MINEIVVRAESLLVVGAHAFDAEVIAGPLAATVAARGGTVTLVHLSLGEQGHPSLPPEEYAKQKRAEAEDAAAALGVSWRTLDLPDGFVPDTDDTALAVGDLVREHRPDVVVTHWRGSWHKDHRAAYAATTNGVLFAGLPTLSSTHPPHIPGLILFGENWEDDEGFRPEHLVDVSPGMQRWHRAIRAYELGRGLSSFPYVDFYSSLYRMRGCLAGTDHAQGFLAHPQTALGGSAQFISAPTGPSAR